MSEANGFKDGDQVILKSGGPVMTVLILRKDEYVSCWWFRGEALQRDAFHKDALLKVPAQ